MDWQNILHFGRLFCSWQGIKIYSTRAKKGEILVEKFSWLWKINKIWNDKKFCILEDDFDLYDNNKKSRFIGSHCQFSGQHEQRIF